MLVTQFVEFFIITLWNQLLKREMKFKVRDRLFLIWMKVELVSKFLFSVENGCPNVFNLRYLLSLRGKTERSSVYPFLLVIAAFNSVAATTANSPNQHQFKAKLSQTIIWYTHFNNSNGPFVALGVDSITNPWIWG